MIKRRIPKHVGFIPDGNRRWAVARGLDNHEGYHHGIGPGVTLLEQCKDAGIAEASIYCFTKDNTKRPTIQKDAFKQASLAFAREVISRGAALLVVGDECGANFPPELLEYRERKGQGLRVNLLINYDWAWDLNGLAQGTLRSADVSRLDLVVRWGGGRRLSGFLPVQSVYADFYVQDEYWPDFEQCHFEQALAWFSLQDQTLGG
ncbi:MAG: undecaprenyl diphosphate synthase family protein [Qipengyuania sp.]